MAILKIRGERTQASTGKLVTYEVEFDRVESDVPWKLRILVTGARWIDLAQGTCYGIPKDVNVAPMLNKEVEPHLEAVDWNRLDWEAHWEGAASTFYRDYQIRVKVEPAKDKLYLVRRSVAPTRDDLPAIHPEWQMDIQTWDEGNKEAIEAAMTDEAKRRIDRLLE
jgi:hypothetical protein